MTTGSWPTSSSIASSIASRPASGRSSTRPAARPDSSRSRARRRPTWTGERIWEEAQGGHAIGPNATPKIPATLPGFVAMERVVEQGWPIIVTEVFSLDQVAASCEIYLRVTARTGVRSPFFMSPITGILGDHLKKLAKAQGLDVPVRAMELAGVGLSRRCAALVAERDYPVTLLFGGARIPEDLTGLVGRLPPRHDQLVDVRRDPGPGPADRPHDRCAVRPRHRADAARDVPRCPEGVGAPAPRTGGVRGVRARPALPRQLPRGLARGPGHDRRAASRDELGAQAALRLIVEVGSPRGDGASGEAVRADDRLVDLDAQAGAVGRADPPINLDDRPADQLVLHG